MGNATNSAPSALPLFGLAFESKLSSQVAPGADTAPAADAPAAAAPAAAPYG